jgi:hypothetical protein
MLQHVVAITWNDQVPPNHAETVSVVLQEMAAHISSVHGWRQYDEDASHNEIRAKYFKPYIATRASAQITF